MVMRLLLPPRPLRPSAMKLVQLGQESTGQLELGLMVVTTPRIT